jgi:hypothetical protein
MHKPYFWLWFSPRILVVSRIRMTKVGIQSMNCLYSDFWVVAIHPDPQHNVAILFRTGERLRHRPCSSWGIAGFASTIHWEISQAENWRYERKWFQDVSVLNLWPNQFIEYLWIVMCVWNDDFRLATYQQVVSKAKWAWWRTATVVVRYDAVQSFPPMWKIVGQGSVSKSDDSWHRGKKVAT